MRKRKRKEKEREARGQKKKYQPGMKKCHLHIRVNGLLSKKELKQ